MKLRTLLWVGTSVFGMNGFAADGQVKFAGLANSPKAQVAKGSPVLRNGSGVPGQFYFDYGSVLSPLPDCRKINNTLIESVTAPLERAGFFVDYSFFCVPSGKDSFVIHEVQVEPYIEADVSRLLEALKTLSGQDIFGVKIVFARVKEMRLSAELRVEDEKEHSRDLIWSTMFQDVSFTSYIQYREYMRSENSIFYWESNLSKFRGYVAERLGSERYAEFDSVIQKGNWVSTSYTPTYFSDDDHSVESSLGTGNFRDCSRAETPCW